MTAQEAKRIILEALMKRADKTNREKEKQKQKVKKEEGIEIKKIDKTQKEQCVF